MMLISFTARLNAKRRRHDPRRRYHVGRVLRDGVGQEVSTSNSFGHWTWTSGHALVAEKFFVGPAVLLAGDAAHIFTPIGGFGMNTEIDDVSNLSWKLAAVVRGWAPRQLLATYEPASAGRSRCAIPPRPERRWRKASKGYAHTVPLQQSRITRPLVLRIAPGAGDFLAGMGEEFGSLGIQLGARYDNSPIVPPSTRKGRPAMNPGGLFSDERARRTGAASAGFWIRTTRCSISSDAASRCFRSGPTSRRRPCSALPGAAACHSRS